MKIELYNEDCLDTLKRISDCSIDLMLTDPPYNSTAHDWDVKIDFNKLWKEWERILKPNGVWIFTATQPFSSELILSKKDFFKYEWIWQKSHPTGFVHANKRPLNYHEHILIFYKSQPTYNPIMIKGKINHGDKNHLKNKKSSSKSRVDGNEILCVEAKKDGMKFPSSIQYFDCVDRANTLHETQKPIELFRYLIKTYTNENDLVFDGYSGSGTTAEACIIENRNFIGSELNEEYFVKAKNRIELAKSKPQLF